MTRNEYIPVGCLSMHPCRETCTSNTFLADGFLPFEDMTGHEMIAMHWAMSRKGGKKAVEGLQKMTIGISEHAASFLAFLQTLQCGARPGRWQRTPACRLLRNFGKQGGSVRGLIFRGLAHGRLTRDDAIVRAQVQLVAKIAIHIYMYVYVHV